MDELDPFQIARQPSANRPLLGMTILVVEDSRYSCDAMRLLCLRSGARIRRADCIASARRHLQVYRPTVAIIDLGLPDGSGAELVSELTQANPRIEVVLGISGDSFAEAEMLAAGADGFLEKPLTSLGAFQNAILTHMPADRQPPAPRPVPLDDVTPDPIAYRDDMAHIAKLLCDGRNQPAMGYLAQFVTGVARSARDQQLEDAGRTLIEAWRRNRPLSSQIAKVAGLVQDRLSVDHAI